jgi:hypothetical protein
MQTEAGHGGRRVFAWLMPKVFPPFPDVAANEKMKVNFAVPTAGRWRVGVRALSLGIGSGGSPKLTVGMPF